MRNVNPLVRQTAERLVGPGQRIVWVSRSEALIQNVPPVETSATPVVSDQEPSPAPEPDQEPSPAPEPPARVEQVPFEVLINPEYVPEPQPSLTPRVHSLLNDGAPHDDSGRLITTWHQFWSRGRAGCTCGEMSEPLRSSGQRYRWFLHHKILVLAASA